MLTDEARYHALCTIYSDMEGELRTQLWYKHDGRDPGALEWAFKLDDWESVHAQLKHLLKTPIHYLHEEPKCPVFNKAMVYHGILKNRLHGEGVNEDERADLRMYGIKCYELLMVRRMAMEAIMSKDDASHKARLEVFAKILDLASFEAKFVLKGWDGGPTGFYEKRQEFAELLQIAIAGKTEGIHDKFEDLWLRFRALRAKPKRKDEVCQSPSVSPASGFSGSFSNSFSGWTNSAFSYLQSLTGVSDAQTENTAASGSNSSGAGNGT